jgi:hypothetical protein
MNTKAVLAITTAALACLSVTWAAAAPHTDSGDSIDGSTTITCGTSTMLFGGAVPPNGFMVQSIFGVNGQVLVVNDNGPAGNGQGFVIGIDSRYGVSASTFITPPGYKPMGPVSVICYNAPTLYVAARAW